MRFGRLYRLCILIPALALMIGTAGCTDRQEQAPEGYVEVPGGKVWYRIEGYGTNPPVLVLHGGPGSSSYGQWPLRQLGKDRQVIFYDQLGCGRSERITDTALMTVERYVDEVEALRKALDIEDFFLYGHSWGTMLGMDYYLKYPEHIRAIIFSSPLFSAALWIRDADTLIATLPDSVQQAIRLNEARGTFQNREYKDAVALYYDNFLRRKARTKAQKDSSSLFFGNNVYEYMWGPSEFTATGTLAGYDRLGQLPDIKVPVLLLTGEYDEARPPTVAYYQSLIPGSEFEVIPNSGHVTLHDNPGPALEAIGAFMLQNDP